MTIYNMTLSTTEPYNNVGAVTVRQDDNLTQTFVANIVENGVKKTGLAGYQVFFNAMFDDNIIARDLAQFDNEKGIATYTLRDSFFQQTGEIEAYFSFEKDGKRDSTANFTYYVTEGNCRNIRQGNYIYDLEELMKTFEEIVDNKDFSSLLNKIDKANEDIKRLETETILKLQEMNEVVKKEMAIAKQEMLIEASKYSLEGVGVTYVAHRGANADAPENSLPAFELVNRHNAIETDIRVTKDGHWVCMHDETVDRMTNGFGAVSNLTLSDIKSFKIDNFPKAHHNSSLQMFTDSELKVPTFEEYLAICYKKNKKPVCELKQAQYTDNHFNDLVNIVQKYNMENSIAFISFDIELLKRVKQKMPNVEVHFLQNDLNYDIIKKAKELGVKAGVSVKHTSSGANSSNFKLARDNGLLISVWTVPVESHTKFENMGVDYITTDSKSGNLKYQVITNNMLKNGFKNNTANTDISFVSEVGNNDIQLSLNVVDGSNNYGDAIVDLPSWAIPNFNVWEDAAIRRDANSVAHGTCDIYGRIDPQGRRGQVTVGRNWGERKEWARVNIRYKLN